MDFIRSLSVCVCVHVYVIYSGWPGGICGETLAGGPPLFSHEESLAAGCSPGKALCESATDPEDQPH